MPFTLVRAFREDVWRWLLITAVILLPSFLFVVLYRISTGDYGQSYSMVVSGIYRDIGSLAACFVLPVLIGVRLAGFRGFALIAGAIVLVIVTSNLPQGGLAAAWLPDTFIRAGLMIVIMAVIKKLVYIKNSDNEQHRISGGVIVLLLMFVSSVVLLVPLPIPG